jgi:2-haloacid dehalogenase
LLQAKGFKTAILSNGDEDMIQRAVASSGLADGFDTLISVERLKRYKTVPAAYALIEQETGIMADRTAFISSNRWDIAGAAAFGLHTIWLNRFDRVDEYVDLAPSAIIRGLDQLLAD